MIPLLMVFHRKTLKSINVNSIYDPNLLFVSQCDEVITMSNARCSPCGRMVVRTVILMLLMAQVLGLRDQKFAMEPQDQTAVVGSRVTLPCRVINKSGLLQWTKDGFGLGTHRNLSGFDRYRMIGSDEEG